MSSHIGRDHEKRGLEERTRAILTADEPDEKCSSATSGFDMSLCLSLAESPSSPHPLVHTLDLYAPHVHAGY
jgi:hypothetical protein